MPPTLFAAGPCTAPRRTFHPFGARSALKTLISHIAPATHPTSFHFPNLPQHIFSSSGPSLLRQSHVSMARRTVSSSNNNAALTRPGPTPRTHALSPPASRRQSLYTIGEGTSIQLHWLFRSNIPRRRGMPMPNDVRKRNFFGIGEIIGVLVNVRSLPHVSCLSRAGVVRARLLIDFSLPPPGDAHTAV